MENVCIQRDNTTGLMKNTFRLTMSTCRHFHQVCCVFRPAFGVLRAPESWSKHFFRPFQQKPIKKKRIWGTPSGCRPAFACRPAFRSGLKHSFSKVFSWFQTKIHYKTFIKKKNGWKQLNKSVWTSFQVRAAPESWSKNTTQVQYNKKNRTNRKAGTERKRKLSPLEREKTCHLKVYLS